MSTHKATVRGTISDEITKLPVAGVDVCVGARNDNDCVGYATVETGADGRFAVELAWDGDEETDVWIDARCIGYKVAIWPMMFVQPWNKAREACKVKAGGGLEVDIAVGPGFATEVLVEGPDGKPLAGVVSRVICTNAELGYCYWPLTYHVWGAAGREPKTGPDGRALWKGFPVSQSSERYVISLVHADHAEYLVQNPENLPRDDGLARVTARMIAGASLQGTVTNRKGLPLADATVKVVLSDAAVPRCHEVMKSAKTDADGHYEVNSINPGAHTVSISHPEWQEISLKEFTIPATGQSLDVRLENGAVVTGRVLDDTGAPLAGIPVEALWMKPDWGRRYASTDAQGEFRMAGLPGRHTCFLRARTADRRGLHGYVKLRGSRQDLVFDRRDLATLSGCLVDPATGAPVPQAVSCEAYAPGDLYDVGRSQGTAGDGRFEVALPPGEATILIQAGDAWYAQRKLVLRPGEVHQCGNVIAKATAAATVRVLDAITGQPIVEAMSRPAYAGIWRHLYDKKTTDSSGEFELMALPDVKVKLRVVAPGYDPVTVGPFLLGCPKRREFTVRLGKTVEANLPAK